MMFLTLKPKRTRDENVSINALLILKGFFLFEYFIILPYFWFLKTIKLLLSFYLFLTLVKSMYYKKKV